MSQPRLAAAIVTNHIAEGSRYAGGSGFTAAFVMGTIALGVAFLAALLIPGRVREPRELPVPAGAR